MKYFETLVEDQETTISVLPGEQKVKIYSSEPKTIHKLTKVLGNPTTKYIKSKTYWSGASWEIDFFDKDKLKEVIIRDALIDNKIKPIKKKQPKEKEEKKIKKKSSTKDLKFEQIQFGL